MTTAQTESQTAVQTADTRASVRVPEAVREAVCRETMSRAELERRIAQLQAIYALPSWSRYRQAMILSGDCRGGSGDAFEIEREAFAKLDIVVGETEWLDHKSFVAALKASSDEGWRFLTAARLMTKIEREWTGGDNWEAHVDRVLAEGIRW